MNPADTTIFRRLKLRAGNCTLNGQSENLGVSRYEKFTVVTGKASTINTSLIAISPTARTPIRKPVGKPLPEQPLQKKVEPQKN
ncbi:MAG: hypothetical protein H7222_05170 [Methylotenera sp.]|nr:hypothetical protein [Oligoflexia bacterium]